MSHQPHRILFLTVLLCLFGTTVQAQSNSAGDPYFPLQGNTGYDVQHYTIVMTVDPARNFVDAVVTIDALASNDLSAFNLDFLGFDVSGVTVDGAQATFSRDGQEMTVTPATAIAATADFKVEVTYSGVPTPYHDPALEVYVKASGKDMSTGWREWSQGYIQAMSQPDGAMSWYPSNNTPTDKATFSFRLTVPEPDTAVASGSLKEIIPGDNNTRTFVWEMDHLMSTQVSMVAFGQFEEKTSVSPNGVPIRNYFPVGLAQDVIDAHAVTGTMIDFLSDLIGPYPYDEYGVVVIPGWLPDSGLESQSLSTFSEIKPKQSLIVHELSHQWFGDAITVGPWDSVWLHEGFAVYVEALWAEKSQGVDAYNQAIIEDLKLDVGYGLLVPTWLGIPALKEGQVLPPADTGLGSMYLETYPGGALTLHALRMEVGDKVFFDLLREWYKDYRDVPVTTSDFTALAEKMAGRDLSVIWDTWLHGNDIPFKFPMLTKVGV